MSLEETQDQNDKINPKGIIILGVNIHCEGCANEVLKHLRGFQGVEGVEIDEKNNKVTVKGEKADPTKVVERLRKKSGRNVELISPKPRKQQQKKEEKPKVEVKEVVLRIYIHCEGCAKEVKHCILKMEGVQTVEVYAGRNTVIVKGIMDANKVVEFVSKRGGRHAEIVKQTKTKTNNNNNNSNNNNNRQRKKKETTGDHHYHTYPPHQLAFPPQFFSDENPSSCSLM